MKNFLNFNLYKIDNNIMYLRAEAGLDWYEAQKQFKQDTLKVVYNLDGEIIGAAFDASALFPASANVCELAVDNDFDINTLINFKIINGALIHKKPSLNHVIHTKQLLSAEATEVINLLADAIELDIARPSDANKLLEWRKYRVLLNRIDITTAPVIHWPEKPE